MGPIVRAKIPRMGSQDAKKGNPDSGDPGRNAPGFPGTGSEQEENTRDTNGGIRL